ncbi:hypothetical protein [Paenibacillus gorillae]|uniref:hypothetical protein n=1 Tax=Paenibacillus gorillae TaxID=1243662 RepID=UPI0004B4DF26|nr:hypothetical protein [Paenibacillus gorillae]
MGNRKQFYKTTWFMWLMLFIVSPIGIFLMWQKRLYNAKTRGILSTVFGVYFVIMMVIANQDSNNLIEKIEKEGVYSTFTVTVETREEVKAVTEPKATEKPEVKAPEVKATTEPVDKGDKLESSPSVLAEYIPWAVIKYAGDKSNIKGADRIRSVEIDDKSVFIDLLADDNITKGTIRAEILEKSTEIFNQVFKDRTDVPQLYLSWSLPLQDANGNESIDPVITVSVSIDTAKAIDWDRFTYSNLPKAATSYTEHKVLR